MSDTSGQSLAGFKANNTPAKAQQRRNFAMQPTPLNKGQQWLRDNPPNTMGIVSEVKSMLNPRNLTGANAIQAAIQGNGMSKTQRVTSAVSGVVQGLSFAAGGKGGQVAVEGVSSAIKTGKIVNPKALIQNIKSGERVIIHGSPMKNLTELLPQTGSKAMPKQNVLFGWNPRKPGSGESAVANATRYSKVKGKIETPIVEFPQVYVEKNPGSIYIAKVPKKSTGPVTAKVRKAKDMVVSTKPGKVVAEISTGQPRPKVYENVQQEMRKAGVMPFKTPDLIDNALGKGVDAIDFVIEKSKKIQKRLPKKK